MDDLISRQDAIRIASGYCHPANIAKELAKLPSAQRTGKWIDYSEDGYVECPFCHSATNCDDNIDELHFCFSCGARLEVQDEADCAPCHLRYDAKHHAETRKKRKVSEADDSSITDENVFRS